MAVDKKLHHVDEPGVMVIELLKQANMTKRGSVWMVSACMLACAVYGCNRSEPLLKGTIIMAAIGSDGIIIASDSRTGWLPDKATSATKYKDSTQKIYVVNQMPIAFAGVASFGQKTIAGVIDDYMKNSTDTMDYRERAASFLKFIQREYPIDKYYDLKWNIMLSGCYFKGAPYIIAGIYNLKTFTRKDSFATSNIESDSMFRSYYKSGLKCDTLAIIIEKFIKTYYTTHKSNLILGGPVSIVKILPNNKIEIIKNNFSGNPSGEKEWHTF